MPHTEQLTKWLEQAYGMETEVIDALTKQLPDLTGHREMEAKILEHLERSQRHAALVDGCIARLGGAASAVRKGGLSTFLGSMMSQWATSSEGQLVKYSIADIAAEHFEIATYTVLIAAARGCRDEETVRVCQEILREEQVMARWLEEHLPDDVHTVVRFQAGDEGQKGDQAQEERPLDAAGTLKGRYVYAVFDDEQQAAQAEQALSDMDVQPQRLQGPEAAAHLRGEVGGTLSKIERFVKGIGHEDQHAGHYAIHAESGRIVLAVQCADHDMAEKVTQRLTQHGAYDVKYFSATGTTRMPQ